VTGHRVRAWPLFLIAAPAAVAVWSGWVGLGELCGFGVIHPLPGIAPSFRLNTAITLPVGVEAYGAYALGAWLMPGVPEQAKRFARRSAIGALALGTTGQVIYHLLAAAHASRAPWPVVVLVSCLPVVTLGLATGLTHLLRASGMPSDPISEPVTEPLAEPVTAETIEPVSAIPTEPVIAREAARSTRRPKRKHAGKSRRGGSLPQRKAARAALEAEAVAILDAEPGIGTSELAGKLDCSVSTAQRLKKEIRAVQPLSQISSL
jgi:hypothetical protein